MFDTRRCLNFPQQRRVAGFTQLVEGGVVGASRVGLFSLFDLPLEFLFNILRKKKFARSVGARIMLLLSHFEFVDFQSFENLISAFVNAFV
jgi:hypothetical protein